MLLKLRAGEKLYINGAVLKVERKATIELLNDATFLLEAHVIQPEEAGHAVAPAVFRAADAIDGARTRSPGARAMFNEMLTATREAFGGGVVTEGLRAADALVESSRAFEAMKTIRGLFPLEAEMMKDKLRQRAPEAVAA